MFALLLTPEQLAVVQNSLFFSEIDKNLFPDFRNKAENLGNHIELNSNYIPAASADEVQTLLEHCNDYRVLKQIKNITL